MDLIESGEIPRFMPNQKGWYDWYSGIEWSLSSLDRMGHSDAEEWCRLLGEDWMVPNLAVLTSVLDYSRYNPATELPDTKAIYYWSSTIVAEDPGYAWRINFHDGSVEPFPRTGTSYVRAVRTPHMRTLGKP